MGHRTKSKVLQAAALAITAGVVLAGCSAGGAGAGDSTDSIRVVSRWVAGTAEAKAQAAVIDAFTADTGIKVELTDGLEDVDNQVETAVAAGKSPDLVIVNLFDKTLGWLDAGVTVPVDDYLGDWGLDSAIKEGALEQWRVGETADGDLRGFPFSGFSWPVWYNTELLAKAGVTDIPTTTDELISAAKALRAADIAPVIVGGNDWSGQKLFFQIAQTFSDAENTKDVMQNGGYCDNADFMKGIDLFVKLRDAGVFVDNVEGYTADDMNNTYYAQEAAIMPAGSWAFGGAVDAANGVVENTTLGGFPVPSGAAFTAPSAYQGFTGVGFMVTKKGAEAGHIENVKKLVQAFYADSAVEDFVAVNNVAPVNGDFSEAAANPLLQQALGLEETVNYAVLPDVWIGSASDPITQVTSLAFGGANSNDICSGLDSATL